MEKRTKRMLQILICALLMATILNVLYLTIWKAPENRTAKKTSSEVLVSIQPLPEVNPPVKVELKRVIPKQEVKAAVASAKNDWQTPAENALYSPDVSVRMRAVRTLWNNLTPESVELLAMFLDDKESAVAEEAIDALGHIAKNSELGEEVFAILIAKATDKNFQSRGPALLTAAMVGDPDQLLPVLGSILEEQNQSAREYAVRAIAFVNGPEAVPYLKKILAEGGSRELQRTAYSLLIKAASEEALQILKNDAYSQEREKQVNTVWALSRSNADANTQILSDAVKTKMLGDESLSIIAASRSAPRVFGDAFQSDNLTNTDKRNLLRVVSDNTGLASKDVRNQTAEIIKPLLNSTDEQVQKDAIDALGKIGASDNQAEALASKLESDSPILQGAALYAYAQYTTPNTYKPLKDLWYSEDEKIRRTAFFLSSPFLNNSDMEDLEKAAKHTDEFISKQAKSKIKQLKVQDKILSQAQ